jgi:hypothetical protein
MTSKYTLYVLEGPDMCANHACIRQLENVLQSDIYFYLFLTKEI